MSDLKRVLRLVSSEPWAIEPTKGQQVIDILNMRLEGQKLSQEEIGAIVNSRRDSLKPSGGSVAVIPLFGVISPRIDSLASISGGTSLEGFANRFDDAMANDEVSHIVLHIDSPGGSVHLTAETAAKVFEARGKKPITAIVDGLGASAAYWVAAAADKIIITPTGMAGSIGVFAIHTEFSRADEADGVTHTIVRAGKFKAEVNPHEPLSDEAEEAMQGRINEMYGLFTSDVARFRGTNQSAVESGYGQGRVLTARQALSAGLVDQIASFEDALEDIGVAKSSLRSARAESEGKIAALMEAPTQARGMAAIDGTQGIPVGADFITLTPTQMQALEVAGELSNGMTLLSQENWAADVKHIPNEDDEDLEEDEEAEDEENATEADGDDSEKKASTPETTAPSGQEDTVDMTAAAAAAPEGAVQAQAGEDLAARKARIDGVIALCEAHDVGHRIDKFVAEGFTPEQASKTLEAEANANLELIRTGGVELTKAEAKRYSICRAIIANADQQDNWSGFERDVSDEIAKKLPKDYEAHGGIFVPTKRVGPQNPVQLSNARLMQMRSAVSSDSLIPFNTKVRMLNNIEDMQAILDSETATEGLELVFTEAGDFIDLLRARMKVAALGATILTGLQGPVAFPKQDGAGTFAWVAEDPGSDVADSDLTLTQVALNPKTGMSSTAYTRQLLNQAVVDVDNLVKNDLAAITALGIDLAAINGSGVSNQPTGVLNTVGIGDVDNGVNGGVPDFAGVIDLETDVATANADIGTMAYLTTPGIRGLLKQTEEFPTSNGRPIWTGGMEGEVNGYRAEVSTQVPSNLTDGTGTNLHAVIFGVWSQLMIGYWGSYELVVDPFTLKKQGVIELTSFQMAGIAIRHPESFSAMQDAALS